MWDNKRKVINGEAIINNIIIHHSAGNTMENETDEYIQHMMSDIGFSRGYQQYGYNRETGYSAKYGQNYRKLPGPATGISYAEYHYIIIQNNRLIQLVDDPIFQDVGSVFDQKINAESIAICFAGNYEVNNIPENMIEFFISCLKPDGKLNYLIKKNPDINIIGHKDTGDKTVCPGRYLYTYLPRINKEIRSIK